ncbi:hypothetical protein [Reichenbachiella ulvae]|uniref:Uncharacterized protein n=1 Tax=Reichenbachiella ulvae TaxID=2980104 RepID=A0ABT3CQ20_9BACT|nr:hypothetical protein [Reichenbachiella ulvae]MCV9385666.1 hypothetical protein [Reichenbachiella ulvae]
MKLKVHLKKHIGPAATVLIVMLLFWACEENESYIENDPTINLVLYNYDSLKKEGGVEDTLALIAIELSDLDDTLAYYSDSASNVADSLLKVINAINNGDETLQDERDRLETELARLNSVYDDFEVEDSIASAHNTYWKKVQTKILNGEVKINSITNRMNNLVVNYTDSATSWPIPLDMNADSSLLALDIAGEIYFMTLYYERAVITNEYDEVVVKTFGFNEELINRDEHFDNLRLSCRSSDCIDVESTIYAYF